jgi:PPM family protein phosphatase
MVTSPTLKSAGESHTGRVRTNNEDRFYMDPERGLFVVVDGIGGQAAGEVAAEEAVKRLRTRLERQIGTARERIVEGITLANNEIFRLAQTNPDWDGMACVLTAAVVEDGTVTIGHVGDTRLYKIHGGQIRKVTHDHSPVGEQEDAGQMSELEAMHHPRRNEVLRDVGSMEHTPDDEGFIDIYEIPFEPDAAIIMCSDGLSDLVTSEQMLRAVRQHVGNRSRTVRQLIDLANEASGKDNVTVIFVEGEQFASNMRRQLLGLASAGAPTTEPPAEERTAREAPAARSVAVEGERPIAAVRSATPRIPAQRPAPPPTPGAMQSLTSRGALFIYGLAIGVLLMAFVLKRFSPDPVKGGEAGGAGGGQQARVARTHTVGPQGAEHATIAAAIEKAQPGDTVLVAPDTYREAVRLKEGVHLVSQSPHGAVILPPEGERDFVAVSAEGVKGARVVGFRIADEGRRLETGIRLTGSSVEIENVDVSGARSFGVEIRGKETESVLRWSFIHDNARGGVLVADGAYPRLVQNLFTGNNVRSTPSSRERTVDVEIAQDARARLGGNVFTGTKDNVLGAVEWEGANYFEAKPLGGAPPPAAAGPPPG